MCFEITYFTGDIICLDYEAMNATKTDKKKIAFWGDHFDLLTVEWFGKKKKAEFNLLHLSFVTIWIEVNLNVNIWKSLSVLRKIRK